MDAYFLLKLKRKDLDDVSDDFSEFSLSSPARKIRRLDAELPPIIEEEECEIPTEFDHSMLQEQTFDCNSSGGIKIEELPTEPSNEERAIVLFKPINNNSPFVHSSSNFSVSVSPELISGLKNQIMWSSQSNTWRLADNKAEENNNSGSGYGSLAVVPWVPSQHGSASASAPVAESPSQINNSEMMDDEEVKEEKMDVEDGSYIEQSNVNEGGGMSISEGLNQWQQQHCLIPQPPQNATAPAPIVWYR